MGRVTHADTQRMMTWLLSNRKEQYFTVEVTSASAPFTYSFTPYITAGESFWVDWGDGNEDTFTTTSTAEKSHEYSTTGTKTIRMLGSAGINRVRISPTDAGQAALVIGSNGNLDKLGTITVTDNMFRACPNLVMTELTGGITSIGANAFRDCTSLALTSLPEGVTDIGESAFRECPNISMTSLPANVSSIGDYAFWGSTNLALTSLPAGIASIGVSAFRACVNITLTSLPEGITTISAIAFYGCTKLALTSLTEGVTAIGDYAFYECISIDNLIFLGTPTSMSPVAFTGSGANLFVPWSSGAVAGAPWGAASVTYHYTP